MAAEVEVVATEMLIMVMVMVMVMSMVMILMTIMKFASIMMVSVYNSARFKSKAKILWGRNCCPRTCRRGKGGVACKHWEVDFRI